MEQANGIFQVPEGSFNAPSHTVEFFQFDRRKCIGIQIGYDRFVGFIGDLKANDGKGERGNDRKQSDHVYDFSWADNQTYWKKAHSDIDF